MNRPEFGLLYVANGARYVEECVESARSARAVMPGIPTALWTDQPPGSLGDTFDVLGATTTTGHPFLDRIPPLRETPFRKTLYLDSDTWFLEDVTEISELLDHFQLAYAHAPYRIIPGFDVPCPPVFPEPNAGIIAYRSDPATLAVLARWEELYRAQLASPNPPPKETDQPALRQVVYEADIRTTILPPEYNFRTPFPAFKGAGLPVKILHGRDPSRARAAAAVNRTGGMAVFDFGAGGSLYRRVVRKVLKTLGR